MVIVFLAFTLKLYLYGYSEFISKYSFIDKILTSNYSFNSYYFHFCHKKYNMSAQKSKNYNYQKNKKYGKSTVTINLIQFLLLYKEQCKGVQMENNKIVGKNDSQNTNNLGIFVIIYRKR